MRCLLVALFIFAPVAIATATDEPDWEKVVPEGDKFKALFPGKPTESSDPPNIKDSKKAIQQFVLIASPGHSYVASFFDLGGKPTPKEAEMNLLEKMRDFLANKETVVKDVVVDRNGLKGRAFTVKSTSGSYKRSLIFIRNDRIYHAFVQGTEDQVGNKDADRFLDSFELLPDQVKTGSGVEKKDWAASAPEGGKFRILFPGKPSESSNPPNTKDSKKATQLFVYVASPTHLYVATYVDLGGKPTPKEAEMRVLENVRDRHAKEGSLIKDEIVERSGLKGRHYTVKTASGTYQRYLSFLRNDRLYEAFIFGTEMEVLGNDADRFLNSLEFLPENNARTPVSEPDALPAGVIAIAGFNNTKGLNSSSKSGSPYPLGRTNAQGGFGEPGWKSVWPASPKATFVKDVVYEGDGALHLVATVNYGRDWTKPQAGQFVIEMAVRCPVGGGMGCYVWKDPRGTGPYWIIQNGKFRAMDGKGNGNGPCTDTGKCEPDTWHKIKLSIDVPKQRWSMQIDGGESHKDFGFRMHPDVLQGINFLVESPQGVYIDAIRVLQK
jgi:hypothetical protein